MSAYRVKALCLGIKQGKRHSPVLKDAEVQSGDRHINRADRVSYGVMVKSADQAGRELC